MDWMSVYSPEGVRAIGTQMLNPAPVVPTGLPMVDKMLWFWGDKRGIPRGEYVVTAGASNSGKTQLSLYLLRQAALAGERCAVFSLDMRRDDLLIRLYQGVAPDLSRHDWLPSAWDTNKSRILMEGVKRAAVRIGKGDILVSPRCPGDLDRIMDQMAMLIEEQGVTWIMLDHLQKVRVEGLRANQMSDRVEIIGEELAGLAYDKGVTINALSQLTASASRNVHQSPSMYDCYGGTGVVSNSTLAFICDHTLYRPLAGKPHMAQTWILFAKSRMGPKGFRVPVMWDHAQLHIRQASPGEEDQWPEHEGG